MDDMKYINDHFGHESGDASLKVSARILQRICSENAFIMRYGGDEFIIIDSGKNRSLGAEIIAAADEYNRASGMPFGLMSKKYLFTYTRITPSHSHNKNA